MTRSLYSAATWVSLVIDCSTWDAFSWNWNEVGFADAVTTLIGDHHAMLDELMEARQNYCDLYRY